MSSALSGMKIKISIVILIIFILTTEYCTIDGISGFDRDLYYEGIIAESDGGEGKIYKDLSRFSSGGFIRNDGQIENPEVRYYLEGGGVWFTDSTVWYSMEERLEVMEPLTPEQRPLKARFETSPINSRKVILNKEFIDANIIEPQGISKLDRYCNFFYGNDPSKWRTKVPVFQEVYFENVYDGIDLRYYSNLNGLKYDLIVHPGADVNDIKIRYNGAEGLEINTEGDLIIRTGFGNLRDSDLFIYQRSGDMIKPVDGEFMILDTNVFSYHLRGDYNKNNILVIDPSVKLEYSTYLGGSDVDSGEAVTADSYGNAYVTGYTESDTDFPLSSGAYNTTFNGQKDVFVTKMNSSGTGILYSTYLGGDGNDDGHAITVDSGGYVYVTGETWSEDFPVTDEAYDKIKGSNGADVFITKINPTGTDLIYSTFVGGNNWDYGKGIYVDSIGNAIVHGEAMDGFPTTSGSYDPTFNQYADSFVLKLNKTGSKLIFSTFVGGGSWDHGYGLAVDSDGDIYITGYTSSDNFPTTPGANSSTLQGQQDIYVCKLSSDGSKLLYSTLIGGSGSDLPYCIAVDSYKHAVISGRTRSSDFPTTPGAYDDSYGGGSPYGDCFIVKLNETGGKLLVSTFIGDDGDDDGMGIAVDGGGDIYVAGSTRSAKFPVTEDAYQGGMNSLRDGFILKFSSNGSKVLYSSFLGGNYEEELFGLYLDPVGNAYITGYTRSDDFPTSTGAYDNSLGGTHDCVIVKIAFQQQLSVRSMQFLVDEVPTSQAYSKLGPYTFRVLLYNPETKSDLDTVKLTLAPLYSDIQLLWTRTTDEFSVLSDPQGAVSIDPSSKSNYYYYFWTIDFNLFFNWNYPDESLNDVQVYVTSLTLSPAWFNASLVYRVENDLVLNGTLKVTGFDGRQIHANGLVKGGEELTWSGLIAVYEGTEDEYPPADEFDVVIRDEVDDFWIGSPASGGEFSIKTTTVQNTNTDKFSYYINLTGIPPECDASNCMFNISVDSTNVTFTSPVPGNTTWQTTSDVTAGITITDIGGGVVNGSSVMHSESTDNGTTWTDWTSTEALESEPSLEVRDTVTLTDGKLNLIRWQAEDSVRNGPAVSKSYRILVDTENVTFSDALPLYSEEASSETVSVGITIEDEHSGVNASTIEYTISYDEGKTWSPWTKIKGYDNGLEVIIKVNLTFRNGTGNRIMWRARDLAGNGPAISEQYIVKVNTWLETLIPKVKLHSPEDGATIPSDSVELKWVLLNANLVDVTYDIYVDLVNPPIELEKIDYSETTFLLEDLDNNVEYYWIIVPKVGKTTGQCLSGIWSFRVDFNVSVPEVNLISPENGAVLNTLRPTFTWELDYTGTDVVLYDIYLDYEIPPKRIIEGYPLTEYTPGEDLENGRRYFWSILPKAGSIIGTKSQTRSFTIDKDFVPEIDFELTLIPDYIEVTRGDQSSIKISIKNLGELKDTFYLDYDIPLLSGISLEFNDTGLMKLDPQDTSHIDITINVDDKAKQGEVFVVFTAISGKSIDYSNELEKSKTLKIKILEEEKDSTERGLSDLMLFIIAFIIIIVLIIVIALFYIKQRKKRIMAEVEYIPPGTAAVLPGSFGVETGAITAAAQAAQVRSAIDVEQVTAGAEAGVLPSPAQGRTGEAANGQQASAVAAAPSPQPYMPPRPQLPPSETAKAVAAAEPVAAAPGQVPEEAPTPIPRTKPVPTPVPPDIPRLEPRAIQQVEQERIERIFDFGIEGGPKQVEKKAVSHEPLERKVVATPDLARATADLQAARVVEPTDGAAVVHEGDKGVWKPKVDDSKDDLGKNERILEQLEKLGHLREKGLLTEAEFEQKKKDLLRT